MIRLSSAAVRENRMAMYLTHSKGGKITSATSSSRWLIGNDLEQHIFGIWQVKRINNVKSKSVAHVVIQCGYATEICSLIELARWSQSNASKDSVRGGIFWTRKDIWLERDYISRCRRHGVYNPSASSLPDASQVCIRHESGEKGKQLGQHSAYFIFLTQDISKI